MTEKVSDRFQCVVCGKLTAGRIPRQGRHTGDTTARFPRRHNGPDGKPCGGNILDAKWCLGNPVGHETEER